MGGGGGGASASAGGASPSAGAGATTPTASPTPTAGGDQAGEASSRTIQVGISGSNFSDEQVFGLIGRINDAVGDNATLDAVMA